MPVDVCVTGAAGFLGTHLVERLLAEGHEVTAVDDLSTGRLDSLAAARAAGGLTFVRFDVCDDDLPAVVRKASPEVLCHLAVRRGDELLETRANVLGTAAVLHAARTTGVRKVVLASDAVVYGRPRTQPVSERAGLAPTTSYGASRACAEVLLAAAGDLETTSLVLSGLYGARRRTGVVSAFARAAVAGLPGTVFGDGSAVRDLLHVDDAVDALVRATGTAAGGRRLNIGSGTGTTVRDLHRSVAEVAGVPDAPQTAPALPGELPGVVLDVGAARRALGWEPFTPLRDGLVRTVAELRGS